MVAPPPRPQLVARAVIEREGRILLVSEKNAPIGLLNLPGGRVELGETLDAAIARELAEELDLIGQTAHYLGLVENKFETPGGLWHTAEHIFHIALGRDAPHLKEPGMGLHWVEIERLGSVDFRPHQLRDHLSRSREPFLRMLAGGFAV